MKNNKNAILLHHRSMRTLKSVGEEPKPTNIDSQ